MKSDTKALMAFAVALLAFCGGIAVWELRRDIWPTTVYAQDAPPKPPPKPTTQPSASPAVPVSALPAAQAERKAMGVCHLYWTKADGYEPDDVVFVWKEHSKWSVAHTVQHLKATEDQQLEFFKFTTLHAKIATHDSKAEILSTGPGWVEIRGTGQIQGIQGFIDAEACRSKPRAKYK